MANYNLKSGEKARTTTSIIWIEQLERRWGEHWQKHFYGYLADLRTQVACSPIHDKDVYSEEDVRNWVRRHVDPDTGEVADEYANQEPRVGDCKKPHIHIIVIVKGPMKREDFTALFEDLVHINPVMWQRVIHLDSMTRYLAHMDNPEKFKYSSFDIQAYGGFSLKPLTIAKTDEYTKANALYETLQYIEDNKIMHYHKVVKWAKELGDYDVFCCVTGRHGFFADYFRSMSQERAEKREKAKREREKAMREAQK